MKLSDLSKEQLMLLNTRFPAEIEKKASAIVANEQTKIAHLEEVASACMAYGAELAMQKIAEMEQKHQEKIAQEEEESKGLDKAEEKEEEEEESSEEEKNAAAMGQFILEGYWNTLMEKGAEYYGDKNIYVEELCKEAAKQLSMIDKAVRGAKAMGMKAMKKGKQVAKATTEHVKKNKGAYGAGAAAGGAGFLAGRASKD